MTANQVLIMIKLYFQTLNELHVKNQLADDSRGSYFSLFL